MNTVSELLLVILTVAGYSHSKFVVTWFGLEMVLYTHMWGAYEASARVHTQSRPERLSS